MTVEKRRSIPSRPESDHLKQENILSYIMLCNLSNERYTTCHKNYQKRGWFSVKRYQRSGRVKILHIAKETWSR